MTNGRDSCKSDFSKGSLKKPLQNKPWYDLVEQDDFPKDVAKWVTEQLKGAEG